MARNRKRNRQRKAQMASPRGMGMATPEEGMPMPMNEGQTPMPMGQGMGQGMGGPAPGMGQAPATGMEEEEGNVSPEEQALYHKFMENYYTLMYVGGKSQNGKTNPPAANEVVERYFSGSVEDPTDALANAGVTFVKNLADSAANSGKPIPGDVLMHAGTNEILPDLAELAEKAGYHDYTEDELNVSLFKAMDLYQSINAESLDKDAIKGDFEAMVQADKEGRLGEVLPGIEEAAEKLPKPEPGQQVPPEEGQPVTQQPTQGMGRV